MALGVVLVGVTGWLVVRVVVLPRLQIEFHLRHVESYGFERTLPEEAEFAPRGWINSALNSAAETIGRTLIEQMPRLGWMTRGELTAAGYYDISQETAHGYRAIVTAFVTLIILVYGIGTGGFSLLSGVLAICLVVAVWMLPGILIRQRGTSRLTEIDRELPQLIDLLVATVEAGISFGGALSSVANRFSGPLGYELRITMQQQTLGISTERALNEMVERCETPSVRSFVRAVIRAESHGASIGPVMRHLAHDIRQRRRDAARERIQKAPIKLLFPLVLFILLPLMIVIMYPAFYNIIHILAGK
jgi:Flp pilus assembly protein TadB